MTNAQIEKARACALRIASRYGLADPQDAAQDAVLAISNATPATAVSLDTWLYRQLRDFISARRRSLRGKPVNSEFDEATHSCELQPDWEAYARREKAERILGSITDPKTRQIADLILDGHTIRSAADQAGLTETAARKRLRKLSRPLL